VLAWRIILMTSGVVVGLLGAVQLLVGTPVTNLLVLAGWMIGAVVIHDGVLAPVVVAVGWAVGRVVPARARRYLQAFLVAGGLVTIVAVPLIARRGTQETAKAILQQNYGANLTLLLGLFAAGSLLAYAAQVAADQRRAQPPADTVER
jgi:hypothetical protein